MHGSDLRIGSTRYSATMHTLRDHHSPVLFDFWGDLGPQRRRLLEKSWAGVFRDFLLKHLPVGELAPHFCDGFGRPSKDLSVAIGALILQQLHDLTDEQTVEAIASTSHGITPWISVTNQTPTFASGHFAITANESSTQDWIRWRSAG